MDKPEFSQSQILEVVAAIARDWSTTEDVQKLQDLLRSIPDAQVYLHQVADLSPAAAQNLVRAALLGLSISVAAFAAIQE